MEQEVNPTEESQSNEPQLSSVDGAEAVTQPEALTLAEINEITGMSYKSKEAALKSIKDFKSQAGRVADLEGRPDGIASLKAQIDKLEQDNLIQSNPLIGANLGLLQIVAKGASVSLKEAAELPEFKSLIGTQTGTETVTKRTIASSNNRTVQSTSDQAFNAAEHAGDAQKMGEHVVNAYFKK